MILRLFPVGWLVFLLPVFPVTAQEPVNAPEPFRNTPHRVLKTELTGRDVPAIGHWIESLHGHAFTPERLLGRIAELRQSHPNLTPEEMARQLIDNNPELKDASAIGQLQRWQQQLGAMTGILPDPLKGLPEMPTSPPGMSRMPRSPSPGDPPFLSNRDGSRFLPSATPVPAPGDPYFPGSPAFDFGPEFQDEIFTQSPEDLRRRRQYQAFKEFWERNFGPLDGTPAFQQLLMELFVGNDPVNLAAGDGLSMLLGDPEADPNAMTRWLETQLSTTGFDFSQFEFPRLSLPSVANELPATPSLASSRSWSGVVDPLTQLGWAILAIGCGLLVYLLLRHLGNRSARSGIAPTLSRVSSWPVDPRMISNKNELVCAFEYLSLTIFGSSARSWHHRTIAQAIEQHVHPQGSPSSAVEDLVGVYVLARYAPTEEPLNSDRIAAARITLCRIAGITGS